MADTWIVKKHTRGINQSFNIKESDDVTAKNISGYTVTLRSWNKDVTLISASCTISSGLGGQCYWTITSGTIVTPGRFFYDFWLVKGSEAQPTKTYTMLVEEAPKG